MFAKYTLQSELQNLSPYYIVKICTQRRAYY